MTTRTANPRRALCSICGKRKRIIRVMRPKGQGGQPYDDPDYAIRFCDGCDSADR